MAEQYQDGEKENQDRDVRNKGMISKRKRRWEHVLIPH